MLRILRAFAWLRWRMLVNSFERTGTRDVVERFSLAVEKLGPIVAAILIVPSALVLAALAAAAGYAAARGDDTSILLLALRGVLFLVPLAAILGPLFLPSGDRTNPVRMLLLPIPRSTLYVSQAATTLGEPWLVLMLPIVAAFPPGLAAGGAVTAALAALAGGTLLLAGTMGVAALATTLLHLAVRDRRRAELLGVIFILLISMAGLLPGMLQGSRERTADGRRADRDAALPAWVAQAGRRIVASSPGELYVGAARQAAAGDALRAVPRVAALALFAAIVHALGFAAFARVLDGPAGSTSRRGYTGPARWGRTLPGLSPGGSAVAMAHVRLALRTTRGRVTLMSPLLMLAMFGILALRGNGMSFGGIQLEDGVALAGFTSFVALISILPIAMNQFAVDGPGLTLAFLSPLAERDLLAGKAVGNALISVPMSWLCVAGAFALFPAGSPAVWLSIPLAMVATFLLVAPAAAIFSAVFPRVVDLSSIGGRGNAHGLAGLFGLLTFVISGLPPVLLVLLATKWLGRPWLAPVLVLAWCGIAFAISAALFAIVVRPVFAARRENLAMLVSRLLSPS